MEFRSEFFNTSTEAANGNALMQYLQHQSPDVMARVAHGATPEIQEIISHNVQGLLGMLPSEGFNIQISTSRENLAGLLASAMMTGYFLRQMEHRMELEKSVLGSDSLSQISPPAAESSED
jgi:hypothetical protein